MLPLNDNITLRLDGLEFDECGTVHTGSDNNSASRQSVDNHEPMGQEQSMENHTIGFVQVQLPSIYQGGVVTFRHDERSYTIDCCNSYLSTNLTRYTCQIWAHLNPSAIAIHPVTAGCRPRIQFSLQYTGSVHTQPLALQITPLVTSVTQHFSALYRAVVAKKTAPGDAKIGILVSSQKGASDTSPPIQELFAGPAHSIYKILTQVNNALPEDAKLSINLAKVCRTVSRTGHAYVAGDDYDGMRRNARKIYTDDDFISDNDSDCEGDCDDEFLLTEWTALPCVSIAEEVQPCHQSYSSRKICDARKVTELGYTMATTATSICESEYSTSFNDKEVDQDEDSDVEFIMPSMSILPHLRVNCSIYMFREMENSVKSAKAKKKANLRYCDTCYCYVCDNKVSLCPNWRNHCNASSASSTFKKLKEKYAFLRKSTGMSNEEIYHSELIEKGTNMVSTPRRESRPDLVEIRWMEKDRVWEVESKKVNWILDEPHAAIKTITYQPQFMLTVWPKSLDTAILGIDMSVTLLELSLATLPANTGEVMSTAESIIRYWSMSPVVLDEQWSLMSRMSKILPKTNDLGLAIFFLKNVVAKAKLQEGEVLVLLLEGFNWDDHLLGHVNDLFIVPSIESQASCLAPLGLSLLSHANNAESVVKLKRESGDGVQSHCCRDLAKSCAVQCFMHLQKYPSNPSPLGVELLFRLEDEGQIDAFRLALEQSAMSNCDESDVEQGLQSVVNVLSDLSRSDVTSSCCAFYPRCFRLWQSVIVHRMVTYTPPTEWYTNPSRLKSIIEGGIDYDDDLVIKLIERSSTECKQGILTREFDILLRLLDPALEDVGVQDWNPSITLLQKVQELKLCQAQVIIANLPHFPHPTYTNDIELVCNYVGYTLEDLSAWDHQREDVDLFRPSISSDLSNQRPERSRLLAKLLQFLSKTTLEDVMSLISHLGIKSTTRTGGVSEVVTLPTKALLFNIQLKKIVRLREEYYSHATKDIRACPPSINVYALDSARNALSQVISRAKLLKERISKPAPKSAISKYRTSGRSRKDSICRYINSSTVPVLSPAEFSAAAAAVTANYLKSVSASGTALSSVPAPLARVEREVATSNDEVLTDTPHVVVEAEARHSLKRKQPSEPTFVPQVVDLVNSDSGDTCDSNESYLEFDDFVDNFAGDEESFDY